MNFSHSIQHDSLALSPNAPTFFSIPISNIINSSLIPLTVDFETDFTLIGKSVLCDAVANTVIWHPGMNLSFRFDAKGMGRVRGFKGERKGSELKGLYKYTCLKKCTA